MAAGGSSSSRSLEITPTWAVATVCFVIILISILLEHSIHLLINWLKKRRKTALFDAANKMKSELMLLGFMSLLLAITQRPISSICISPKFADVMLPCRKEVGIKSKSAADSCAALGKVGLISEEGIQQLQIFIFVLAVMQIVYSVLTFALGRAKMRRWKAWEEETQTTEYLVANDPNRFRFTRQTTFGKRHETLVETSIHLWAKCFFRQFFNSVAKVDYLTLRHGFIVAHLSKMNNKFNFQKYINRTLEEDFKVLFSIRPQMWLIVVIFMLVDVHGWNVYLWVSYVPLLTVLILGTKMEVIVIRMALRLKDQNSVVVGTPLIQPNDDYFWFRSPKFLLTLLHFTLFVNAFEFAFFIWVTVQFGVDSCYHEHTVILVTRIVLAVMVQVLCSYITLPLYALVTQMGSEFKSKAIEEPLATKVLKRWHADVREKRKTTQEQLPSSSPQISPPSTSLSANLGVGVDSTTSTEASMPPRKANHEYSSRQGEIIEER